MISPSDDWRLFQYDSRLLQVAHTLGGRVGDGVSVGFGTKVFVDWVINVAACAILVG